MTSPMQQLQDAARKIIGAQAAQQEHAKQVAASLPAKPPAQAPEQPPAGQAAAQ